MNEEHTQQTDKKTQRISTASVVIFSLACMLAASAGWNIVQHNRGLKRAGDYDARYRAAEQQFTAELAAVRAELAGARETIERERLILERERGYLERERGLHREAQGIIAESAELAKCNARTIQEAIGLIRKIREKVEVLERLYAYRSAGGGSD